MARKVGGHYRDQYFEKYMDFLRKETDESREKEGKDPYSDVTLKTMAMELLILLFVMVQLGFPTGIREVRSQMAA